MELQAKRCQQMNKYRRWNASLIFAGIILTLTTGCVALVSAEEEEDIPDHANFQSCQACHAEKHDMWETSGHGKAIRRIAENNASATDCSGCHSAQRPEAGRQEPMIDNANKESFHRISCLACHSRQKSRYDHSVVMNPEELCDVCHTQRAVFWGKGARGIEEARNFHSGVPCISCHMTEGNHQMKVLRPDDPGLTDKRLDTCTACHKDNNREARVQQIQEWQSTYDENTAPLLEDTKTIEAALKKSPGLLDATLKSRFDDVKANLELLEKDGSRGFHNFVFSLEIASMASRELKEIKATIK
jgi:predicted CXXCH cytochrome family protein